MHTKWIVNGTAIGLWLMLATAGVGGAEPSVPGGALHIVDQDGTPMAACPLTHTDVEADISGFVSRVRVRQTFHNPLDKKIEALLCVPTAVGRGGGWAGDDGGRAAHRRPDQTRAPKRAPLFMKPPGRLVMSPACSIKSDPISSRKP